MASYCSGGITTFTPDTGAWISKFGWRMRTGSFIRPVRLEYWQYEQDPPSLWSSAV